MSIKINSLAEFKRFLSLPGATIQLTRHDWAQTEIVGNGVKANFTARPGFWEPRKVKKLQTNAVCFTTPDTKGSWLYFDSAKQFRFDGADVVTVDLDKGGKTDPFTAIMQYRCWVE